MVAPGFCKFGFVSIDRIDATDRTFHTSFSHGEERLRQSIAQWGVNQPLCLWPNGNQFALVDGFRRYEEAQQLGLRELPACIVAPERNEPLDWFLATLDTHLLTRGLNRVEQALAIRKLSEGFAWSNHRLITEALSRLGYQTCDTELQKLTALGNAHIELQAYVVRAALPASFAFRLAALPLADQRALVNLFGELPCSLGKRRDIVTLAEEIAHREHTSIEGVLDEARPFWAEPQHEQAISQRVQRLRDWLANRRYPRYRQAERDWNATRHRLGLPAKISLNHAPYFEGDQLTVQFAFRRPQELRRYAEQLLAAADKPELAELIERT